MAIKPEIVNKELKSVVKVSKIDKARESELLRASIYLL